jgi:hypothetical protein
LYRNEGCLRTARTTALLGVARIMDRVGVMQEMIQTPFTGTIIHIWVPVEQIRMIEKYRIDPHQTCIEALQSSIHKHAQDHAPWAKFQREIIEVP